MRSTDLLTAFLTLAVVPGATAWAQCETARFRGSDTIVTDAFGRSVAVDGERAIVGAPERDDLGSSSGAAYVFVRTASGWVEEAKLLAADGAANDGFGGAVGIDGTRAVVGAAWHSDPEPLGGAVYVFERQGGGWVQTAKLEGTDFAARLGSSVDVDGPVVVAGAPYDTTVGNSSGAVHVFEESGGTWTHVDKLVPADLGLSDFLGVSVAVSGERLIGGAPSHHDPVLFAGAAYVYERTNGVWLERAKLSATAPQGHSEFGQRVAIDGARALVGASFLDGPVLDAGAAYVFEEREAGWVQTAMLQAADPSYNMHFGYSVALSGDAALVGSILAPAAGVAVGAGYWFRLEGSDWVQQARLVSHGANSLGVSAALDGETGILGEGGRVRTFALPGFSDPYCHCTATGPCGNSDPSGGCAHSEGRSAQLGACGSASVAADDLVLVASLLPESSVVLLFAGDMRVNGGQGVAFGDGLLCVEGRIRRLGTLTATPAGGAQWGPGLAAAGGWSPGEVRDLQVWFRDPSGPCGSGFGLTNAVELTFGP